jgi:hypothetical protein
VTIAIEEAIGTGKSVSLPFAHAPAVQKPSSLKTQQFENLDDQEFGIATRTRFE